MKRQCQGLCPGYFRTYVSLLGPMSWQLSRAYALAIFVHVSGGYVDLPEEDGRTLADYNIEAFVHIELGRS